METKQLENRPTQKLTLHSPIEDFIERCELYKKQEVLEVLKRKEIDTVENLESLIRQYDKIQLPFATKDTILLEYVTLKNF